MIIPPFMYDATELELQAGGDATEALRRVGRYHLNPGMQALRRALGFLCRRAPRLASSIAYLLLTTPPRARDRVWQKELRARATDRFRLQVGRRRINVYAWGAGPAVLLVHGWGASAVHMGKLIDPLVSAGKRVIAFDAPAHGTSPGLSTDLVEFASAVARVAQRVGPVETLMAHSFGVPMALWAQKDWGFEVGRQVLISSINHCKWVTDEFGRLVNLTPEVAEMGRQMMVNRHNGRMNWEKLSTVDMLRGSRVPTLLIHDCMDDEVPFQHTLDLARAMPTAHVHLTSGRGHNKVLGDPSMLEAAVSFAIFGSHNR